MLVTSPFGRSPTARTSPPTRSSASPTGVRLTVLDLGATVARLQMPVPGGGFADVVLGLAAAADYASPTNPYLGATVGRYANRIAGARFTLDGTRHELARQRGHHLPARRPGGLPLPALGRGRRRRDLARARAGQPGR